jgi:spore coat polysaccharide biosynthesis predicted glycosyltransferase SpsG
MHECEYEIIVSHLFDVLYVDGNIFYSKEDALKIKQKVSLIMYQNLSESRFYADTYILPSIHQEISFFKNFNSKTKLYKGLQYFTFNEDVKNCTYKEISEVVSSIAITTGGSDPNNVLLSLFKLISDNSNFNSIKFTFYYGKNFMHKDLIPSDAINFHFKEFNLEHILESDLIISAFGVTSYELLALGVPLICVGHQKSTAEASDFLAKYTNGFLSLGIYNTLSSSQLNSAITSLLKHDIRKLLSEKAKSLLDFNGINRVANIIENLNNEKQNIYYSRTFRKP